MQAEAENVRANAEIAHIAKQKATVFDTEYLEARAVGNCSAGVSMGDEWSTVVAGFHLNTLWLVHFDLILAIPACMHAVHAPKVGWQQKSVLLARPAGHCVDGDSACQSDADALIMMSSGVCAD